MFRFRIHWIRIRIQAVAERTPKKDIQIPGDVSGPTENSTNMKFLHFCHFWGHFSLPGSGFPILSRICQPIYIFELASNPDLDPKQGWKYFSVAAKSYKRNETVPTFLYFSVSKYFVFIIFFTLHFIHVAAHQIRKYQEKEAIRLQNVLWAMRSPNLYSTFGRIYRCIKKCSLSCSSHGHRCHFSSGISLLFSFVIVLWIFLIGIRLFSK